MLPEDCCIAFEDMFGVPPADRCITLSDASSIASLLEAERGILVSSFRSSILPPD
jgi:hypothetical protein